MGIGDVEVCDESTMSRVIRAGLKMEMSRRLCACRRDTASSLRSRPRDEAFLPTCSQFVRFPINSNQSRRTLEEMDQGLPSRGRI
ncbi:hypothetical protein TcasGA2_TC011858 [Tribolium castaneum]|uniref:Uncharacterized protein n=1 Tax=Tribolium castaneum TaxID=7070 RepID=D6WZD3_TRICA|nr:hypothetical protein TcasGA2_TC011858 [Tribolium castaneum]